MTAQTLKARATAGAQTGAAATPPTEADLPTAARLHEIRALVVALLARSGITEAEVEADILLGWLLKSNRAGLVLAAERRLTKPQRQRLLAALARRQRREPLAYILGEWEFWSLPFTVGPEVLIPRPETELLVEQALAFVRAAESDPAGAGLTVLAGGERVDSAGPGRVKSVKKEKNKKEKKNWRILDLGTGSGILAVVLAREIPTARVVALDRSPAALALAQANVRRHGVAGRVSLVGSDWLTALRPRPSFDLVVANPPYVVREQLATLQPEVRDYEPRTALDGGEQGLDDIGAICRQLPALLAPGGLLLMEIGWDQQAAVSRIFAAHPAYHQTQILPDLAGLPRVLCSRRR